MKRGKKIRRGRVVKNRRAVLHIFVCRVIVRIRDETMWLSVRSDLHLQGLLCI